MKKGWFIGAGISAMLILMMFIYRDDMIINAGLRGYRAGMTLLGAILGGMSVGSVLTLLKNRKPKDDVQPVRVSPSLDIGSRLNPEYIKANLYEVTGDATDETVRKAVKTVIKTMDVMDDLQDRLKELLDNNGADALRDTENILDDVEQHICRNVRKFINNITILDMKNSRDREKIVTSAVECSEQNQKLLKLTKDFMTSLVEFLNRQGDSSSEEEINMYKEALTEQLSLKGESI
ncbi:MAG: hypothetical protein K6G27_05840 [Lachnospiraceae bacterium]|nr:hypothetical protein [Lachnospiraceae bacterium]